MSEINERIAALETQLAELKAAVTEPQIEVVSSRRDMFKKLAIGAAGVAAGGALLGKATPAAAAPGSTVLMDQANTSTGFFQSTYTGPNTGVGHLFESGTAFTNNNSNSSYRSALAGWASANGNLDNGIYGFTEKPNGYGVIGFGGIGVAGTVGGHFRGERAAINFFPNGAEASIVLANVKKGDILFTDEGNLWLADADGSLVRLGGTSTAGSAGELFLLDAPVRVYDSRPAAAGPAATGDGPLGASAERAVSLATGFVGAVATPAVPAGATAALVTLTVADTTGSGFLGLFSNALAAWPGTSTINWSSAGQAIATTTVSGVDAAAKVKLHSGGSVVGTNFILDVIGYYG